MMQSNAVRKDPAPADSRGNDEMRELLALLDTEDLNDFSVSGMRRLLAAEDPILREAAVMLAQGNLTIFDVERMTRSRL